MTQQFLDQLHTQTEALRSEGLYKTERLILGPQDAAIQVQGEDESAEVLNFCANNYLGLANHPQVINAAHQALEDYGYGLASVRFICGTQDIHRQLEQRLASFLRQDDAILFAACFDANGGLFEPLLGPEDAIISDALNHASIIDGVRLCKAKRFRYANNDMQALEAQLKAARAEGVRHIIVATDGVFSMDGYYARLDEICALADRYDAMVMVDDCHSTGFVGPTGRGTAERFGVEDRVDILTGTLGKALGGASGGYTAASAPVVDWLRQRSRPYLFSNTLAPVIAAASLKVFDLLEDGGALRAQLWDNAAYFRTQMTALGFELLPGEHAIIPVMLRDPKLAQEMAAKLGERGVYVTAFSFPVVPKQQDRIRTQMSAGLTREMLDRAIDAFEVVGRELEVIQ